MLKQAERMWVEKFGFAAFSKVGLHFVGTRARCYTAQPDHWQTML